MIRRDQISALWSVTAGFAILLTAGCATNGRYKDFAESAAASGAPGAIVELMRAGKRLELGDVSALSRSGVTDEVLMDYLKRQRAVYLLQDREVTYLRESGVTQPVIDYLATTPKKLNRRLYPKGYVPGGVCRPAYAGLYGR